MIVPQYWAESRRQIRKAGRQVTVRRFGWSDGSLAEAQRMADERADAALNRVLAGERLPRREPKVPYNGAEGVPIREEIVGQHGPVVLTRNSYGAICLNTPNVLFADIDFQNERPGCLVEICVLVVFLGLLAVAWRDGTRDLGLLRTLIAIPIGIGIAALIQRARPGLLGTSESRARTRIQSFLERNPDWNLRIYRTPAGLRLLVTQRTFDPDEAEVRKFFRAMRVDPLYARMCLRQKCFRARVTAKPWRIGIPEHLRPRPGVWPIAPVRLPARLAWVAEYEARASGFAACELLDELGCGMVDVQARAVIALHDRLCQVGKGLPLA